MRCRLDHQSGAYILRGVFDFCLKRHLSAGERRLGTNRGPTGRDFPIRAAVAQRLAAPGDPRHSSAPSTGRSDLRSNLLQIRSSGFQVADHQRRFLSLCMMLCCVNGSWNETWYYAEASLQEQRRVCRLFKIRVLNLSELVLAVLNTRLNSLQSTLKWLRFNKSVATDAFWLPINAGFRYLLVVSLLWLWDHKHHVPPKHIVCIVSFSEVPSCKSGSCVHGVRLYSSQSQAYVAGWNVRKTHSRWSTRYKRFVWKATGR